MTIPCAVDMTRAPLVAFVQMKFDREVEIVVQLNLDEGGGQPGFTMPERRRFSSLLVQVILLAQGSSLEPFTYLKQFNCFNLVSYGSHCTLKQGIPFLELLNLFCMQSSCRQDSNAKLNCNDNFLRKINFKYLSSKLGLVVFNFRVYLLLIVCYYCLLVISS